MHRADAQFSIRSAFYRLMIRSLVTVAILLAPAIISDSVAQTVTYEKFSQAFRDIVLGSEYVPRENPRVLKFVDDLDIVIVGTPSSSFLSKLFRHLSELDKLTGLNSDVSAIVNANEFFAQPSRFQSGNIFAFISESRKEYLEFLSSRTFNDGSFSDKFIRENVFCVVRIVPNPRLQIGSAFILFPPNNIPGKDNSRCVVEEFSQALGLPNDSKSIKETIFNDDDVHSELTDLDALLIRALYSDDIKPGDSWNDLRLVLPGVYQRLTSVSRDTIRP